MSEDLLPREAVINAELDEVLQRVFAAGLQLQGITALVPEQVRPTMVAAMAELDGSMAALRHAMSGLGTPT